MACPLYCADKDLEFLDFSFMVTIGLPCLEKFFPFFDLQFTDSNGTAVKIIRLSSTFT